MYLHESTCGDSRIHNFEAPPSPPLPSPPPRRFLTYLGDLCVTQGVAIQNVQMMVCRVVLEEQNADVLMKTRSELLSVCEYRYIHACTEWMHSYSTCRELVMLYGL